VINSNLGRISHRLSQYICDGQTDRRQAATVP